MRVGQGIDAHRFGDGNTIVIGGVHIPFEKGLVAHSDGDVLLHAICDALLGAAGLGDIGRHFPDSDPEYKGADSRKLLRHVVKLIGDKGFGIENIDATIIAQKPKMSPYIAEMGETIAADCQIAPDQVNVKATTTEKMGFAGREEGIATMAVVLLG